MVTRLGGIPFSAPAVREQASHEDTGPILDRAIAGTYQAVVALTGAGVTALFGEADARGRLAELREAMSRMTIVCRGPKPQAAFKRHGLSVSVVTAKPHTSEELLAALAGMPLASTRVMLLHYGERNPAIADAIAAQGALVDDVCLYEWVLPDDLEPLHEVVRRAIDRRIDALLVTSQVQFRFLLEVARRSGTATALVDALNEHVVVGAVGPVCASALTAAGVVPDVLPASPNSASLVGAVADYFELVAHEEDH